MPLFRCRVSLYQNVKMYFSGDSGGAGGLPEEWGALCWRHQRRGQRGIAQDTLWQPRQGWPRVWCGLHQGLHVAVPGARHVRHAARLRQQGQDGEAAGNPQGDAGPAGSGGRDAGTGKRIIALRSQIEVYHRLQTSHILTADVWLELQMSPARQCKQISSSDCGDPVS